MNEQTSRWYMVNKDGMAALCADQADAEQEAKNAQEAWPHMGPHRAVRLVEVGDAGFTAADMATAAAQGFRDGVASVAGNAGSDPVASDGWLHVDGLLYRLIEDRIPRNRDEINVTMADGSRSVESCSRRARELLDVIRAAPQPAVAAGWMPIEMAPEGAQVVVCWRDAEDMDHPERFEFDYLEDGCWMKWHEYAEHVEVIGGHGVSYTPPYTVWMPLPPAPSTEGESGNGVAP